MSGLGVSPRAVLEGKSPREIGQILQSLRTEECLTIKDAGKRFGMTSGWVNQHIAITKLDPEVQKLVIYGAKGRVRENTAQAGLAMCFALLLVDLPHDRQLRVARRFMDRRVTKTYRDAKEFVAALIRKIPQDTPSKEGIPDELSQPVQAWSDECVKEINDVIAPAFETLAGYLGTQPGYKADLPRTDLKTLLAFAKPAQRHAILLHAGKIGRALVAFSAIKS